jgi:hypothetical protein
MLFKERIAVYSDNQVETINMWEKYTITGLWKHVVHTDSMGLGNEWEHHLSCEGSRIVVTKLHRIRTVTNITWSSPQLTSCHRKTNWHVMKCHTGPRTWTDNAGPVVTLANTIMNLWSGLSFFTSWMISVSQEGLHSLANGCYICRTKVHDPEIPMII